MANELTDEEEINALYPVRAMSAAPEASAAHMLADVHGTRYATPDEQGVSFEASALDAFVRELLEQTDAEIAALTKQANAYKTLTESLDKRSAIMMIGRAEWQEAINTLSSERQANALLTAEIAALRQDAERYREYRKGKALVVKCGNLTIFHGSNPDYERKYPEALDAAIDAAMAQAVQPTTKELP